MRTWMTMALAMMITINSWNGTKIHREIPTCRMMQEEYMAEAQRVTYLLAKLAMAEAEGESLEGKAAVVKVAMNRVASDDFPATAEEVILQPGAFCTAPDGRYWTVEPNEDCYVAVQMVWEGWTRDEVTEALYFESSNECVACHASGVHRLHRSA